MEAVGTARQRRSVSVDPSLLRDYLDSRITPDQRIETEFDMFDVMMRTNGL